MFKLLLSALTISLPMIANAKSIVIGVEQIQYKPQYYMQDGQFKGYARDLFDEFAKHSGHEITYKALPVSRLFDSFVTGKVDLKYPDNKFWRQADKQNLKVVYSSPVVKFMEGVLVLPVNEDKPVNYFNTVSTVRGFTPFPLLDLIGAKKIQVNESNDFNSSMFMALKGRTDGVFGNVSVAMQALQETNQANALVVNKNLPYVIDNYYVSSITHPEIIDEFNKFLTDKKDMIAELKEKHKVEQGVE